MAIDPPKAGIAGHRGHADTLGRLHQNRVPPKPASPVFPLAGEHPEGVIVPMRRRCAGWAKRRGWRSGFDGFEQRPSGAPARPFLRRHLSRGPGRRWSKTGRSRRGGEATRGRRRPIGGGRPDQDAARTLRHRARTHAGARLADPARAGDRRAKPAAVPPRRAAPGAGCRSRRRGASLLGARPRRDDRFARAARAAHPKHDSPAYRERGAAARLGDAAAAARRRARSARAPPPFARSATRRALAAFESRSRSPGLTSSRSATRPFSVSGSPPLRHGFDRGLGRVDRTGSKPPIVEDDLHFPVDRMGLRLLGDEQPAEATAAHLCGAHRRAIPRGPSIPRHGRRPSSFARRQRLGGGASHPVDDRRAAPPAAREACRFGKLMFELHEKRPTLPAARRRPRQADLLGRHSVVEKAGRIRESRAEAARSSITDRVEGSPGVIGQHARDRRPQQAAAVEPRCAQPARPSRAGRQRRSRKALATTETLESAIAVPAKAGESRPNAASGKPRTL